MVEHVEAIYENGTLRPLSPVHLIESERVLLAITKPSGDPLDAMMDHHFLEYARSEVARMRSVPSLEEVRQRLSKIEGSMAEFIIAERGDY